MERPIIDGERWIRERLRFLRLQLDGDDLDPDMRRTVEAEVEALAQERGLTVGGHRSVFGRWRRFRR